MELKFKKKKRFNSNLHTYIKLRTSRQFVFKLAIHRSPLEKKKGEGGFPSTQLVKNLPAMQETQVQSLGGEDSLEKGMATHSSILAWDIPWKSLVGSHGITKSRT